MNYFLVKDRMIQFSIVSLLSAISSIAVLYYLDKSFSFFIFLMWASFFKVWASFPQSETKRFYIYNVIFSILFAFCTVIGKELDFNLHSQRVSVFLLTIGLFCVLFPITTIISKNLGEYKAVGSNNKNFRKVCFLFIALSWLAGYLAVFPGIYVNDAPFWYREFDDPAISVCSKWSPVYAGLFYVFVHTGKSFFNNYECGFGLFIAIQSIFILFGIQKILKFIQNRMGNTACFFTTLFFGLVPTHMLMAMQTAQDTPFMVCFAMIIIHLNRMVVEGEEYWQNKKTMVLSLFGV